MPVHEHGLPQVRRGRSAMGRLAGAPASDRGSKRHGPGLPRHPRLGWAVLGPRFAAVPRHCRWQTGNGRGSGPDRRVARPGPLGGAANRHARARILRIHGAGANYRRRIGGGKRRRCRCRPDERARRGYAPLRRAHAGSTRSVARRHPLRARPLRRSLPARLHLRAGGRPRRRRDRPRRRVEARPSLGARRLASRVGRVSRRTPGTLAAGTSAIFWFAQFRQCPHLYCKYLFMLAMLSFVVLFRPWLLDESRNGMV